MAAGKQGRKRVPKQPVTARPKRKKVRSGARAAVGRAESKSGTPSPFGRMCPISHIDVDSIKNARKAELTDAELLELGESLKAGQIQPCLGRAKPGGRVELWVGFRRYAAAVRVGLETLWVEEHRGDEAERSIVNLAENVARCDLTPAEKARAYFACHEELAERGSGAKRLGPTRIDETIAARCGVSRSEVTQYRILAEKLCGKVYRAWCELGSDLPVGWLWDIRNLDDVGQVGALEDRLRKLRAEEDPDQDVGGGEDEGGRPAAERAPAERDDSGRYASRPSQRRLEAELAALLEGGYLDRDVAFDVATSGKLTVDWVQGAKYALEYALGRHAFDPEGSK